VSFLHNTELTMSQYKVRNWSQYNESLKKRGSLSLWVSEDLIEKWQSPKNPHFIGAPQQYSDIIFHGLLLIFGTLIPYFFGDLMILRFWSKPFFWL